MVGLTRVERDLVAGRFSDAVLTGLSGDIAAVRAARATWGELRARVGYSTVTDLLTSGASQHKLAKNSTKSYGLMLTPARGMMSDSRADIRDAFNINWAVNVCPLASTGCALACLSTSGQSGMPAQQRAQSVRTAFLLSHPWEFGLILGNELRRAIRRHGRINLRLNTTSDIRWELVAPGMITVLADAGVTMYDYTAWHPSHRKPSADYHLTYSAKEQSHTSDEYLTGVLSSGHNVAIPFDTPKGKPLPETWHGWRVIDGDKSDERYLDPAGVVVGLRAKGHAWRRDNSAGFIRSASIV